MSARNYNRPEPELGPESETGNGSVPVPVPVPETETFVCPQFLEQLKMLSCQRTARTLRVSTLRSFSYII